MNAHACAIICAIILCSQGFIIVVTQVLPVHRASVTALIWDLPGVQLSSAILLYTLRITEKMERYLEYMSVVLHVLIHV